MSRWTPANFGAHGSTKHDKSAPGHGFLSQSKHPYLSQTLNSNCRPLRALPTLASCPTSSTTEQYTSSQPSWVLRLPKTTSATTQALFVQTTPVPPTCRCHPGPSRPSRATNLLSRGKHRTWVRTTRRSAKARICLSCTRRESNAAPARVPLLPSTFVGLGSVNGK